MLYMISWFGLSFSSVPVPISGSTSSSLGLEAGPSGENCWKQKAPCFGEAFVIAWPLRGHALRPRVRRRLEDALCFQVAETPQAILQPRWPRLAIPAVARILFCQLTKPLAAKQGLFFWRRQSTSVTPVVIAPS